MISLADMLLGRVPAHLMTSEPSEPPAASIKPKDSKASTYGSCKALRSYEKNAGKPCTTIGCGAPRHKSRLGKVFSTKCTKHYTEQQAIQRKKNKRIGG